MNQQVCEEKQDEIRAKLKNIEEEQQDCLSLKKEIESEEAEMERALGVVYARNREIEDDWTRRNMIGNRGYLFSENEETLNRVCAKRNDFLREGIEDLEQYRKELSWKAEEYQEELSRLTKEYENHKKENQDGSHH